jgi:hypothetical protein
MNRAATLRAFDQCEFNPKSIYKNYGDSDQRAEKQLHIIGSGSGCAQ